MAACTAALGTREILENILRRLDFKTLLLAQRVDRQFKTVITDTETLQRKLFRNLQGEDTDACGELIQTAVGETRERERAEHLQSISCNDWVVVNSCNQICVLNTNILQVMEQGCWPLWVPNVRLHQGVLPCTVSANRGKGSWESMYLARPPLMDRGRVSLWETDEERSKVWMRRTMRDFVKVGKGKTSPDGRNGGYDCVFDANSSLRETMDDIEKRMVDEVGYAVNWATLQFMIHGCVMRYGDYLYAKRLKIFDDLEATKGVVHSLHRLLDDHRIGLSEEDRRTLKAVERLGQWITARKIRH